MQLFKSASSLNISNLNLYVDICFTQTSEYQVMASGDILRYFPAMFILGATKQLPRSSERVFNSTGRMLTAEEARLSVWQSGYGQIYIFWILFIVTPLGS